jgi:predicted site-specific integrase-resolvase
MKLGYARVSKADGSQTLDLQIDALAVAGVSPDHVYTDEHPLVAAQKAWLAEYEASYGGSR